MPQGSPQLYRDEEIAGQISHPAGTQPALCLMRNSAGVVRHDKRRPKRRDNAWCVRLLHAEHPRSQERAAEDQACHGEVNHEPGDVDQRCHERRRCTGGIEAEPAQDEGEHGSHQRPPSHDTNEA